jgi:hypothetical protein
MSDFISSIKPWIEDAAFDAIMNSNSNSNPDTEKIRFVQVLRRKSASCIIISDCKTQILCRTTSDSFNDDNHNDIDNDYDNNGNTMPLPMSINIQRGSVVKIKNYKFVLNTNNEQNPSLSFIIELVTDSLEFAGAQGMGIIGDPMDLKDTVQVRRALQHIQHDIEVLKGRLSLQGMSRVNKGKKRGDALALLRQEKLLDQLFMGGDGDEDDDNNDDDKIETQDVLIMRQECKIQSKRKDVHLENNGNGTTKKKLRKGNALALLGDDAKLERVLGMRADGDGESRSQQVHNNHGQSQTHDVNDHCDGINGEYVMNLKDPTPRGTSSPVRKRTKAAALLDTEPMPLPAPETRRQEGANDQSEPGQEWNDENDAESSVFSDPVGISEMLSSPKSKVPDDASKKQVIDKGFQVGPSIARASITVSMEEVDGMPIASTSRLNRQQSGSNDFMKRWRRTRTFYKRLWEQRHENVVIFS